MPAKYGERTLVVKRVKLGDVGTMAVGSLGIWRSGKWSVESQHLSTLCSRTDDQEKRYLRSEGPLVGFQEGERHHTNF